MKAELAGKEREAMKRARGGNEDEEVLELKDNFTDYEPLDYEGVAQKYGIVFCDIKPVSKIGILME